MSSNLEKGGEDMDMAELEDIWSDVIEEYPDDPEQAYLDEYEDWWERKCSDL